MFALLAIMSPGWALSPSYEPYRVELGVGALIGFPRVDLGVGYSFEAKVNLTDHISAGFLWQWAQLFSSEVDSDRVFTARSLSPSVDFHALSGVLRPFIGLSGGRYNLTQGVMGFGTDRVDDDHLSWGAGGQLGVELGRYFIAGAFHGMFETVEVTGEPVWGYVCIDQGLRLGGKRRD